MSLEKALQSLVEAKNIKYFGRLITRYDSSFYLISREIENFRDLLSWFIDPRDHFDGPEWMIWSSNCEDMADFLTRIKGYLPIKSVDTVVLNQQIIFFQDAKEKFIQLVCVDQDSYFGDREEGIDIFWGVIKDIDRTFCEFLYEWLPILSDDDIDEFKEAKTKREKKEIMGAIQSNIEEILKYWNIWGFVDSN
ncbi:MAG: hypothetical protein G01um101418_113 [Parcubacteria group bacterium Gr01-1014_18]|nr:MAG: hypothetical protein Greene041636_417 [Parcubacteria group bacterium Greene0416_36]TSC81440.1 MAG: hypothetical protein G01um101418_113 [Parcubacteria group bacterium Gr01-1014_18]TSC99038.1 MAG: hypothetical protein Greene101420_394 [Parcubacteria group bacterium Greene1014_20]TSD07281.1 MAG: hypothetical protein Greene07142_297 [Parcubacteria group bacterium Greene0714_2]